ncbi:MAG: hypothetical protein Q4A71_04055 [Actinomycetaceae bacterium]|nr:hypothetical protein [Actinomycetaceae bacterium]
MTEKDEPQYGVRLPRDEHGNPIMPDGSPYPGNPVKPVRQADKSGANRRAGGGSAGTRRRKNWWTDHSRWDEGMQAAPPSRNNWGAKRVQVPAGKRKRGRWGWALLALGLVLLFVVAPISGNMAVLGTEPSGLKNMLTHAKTMPGGGEVQFPHTDIAYVQNATPDTCVITHNEGEIESVQVTFRDDLLIFPVFDAGKYAVNCEGDTKVVSFQKLFENHGLGGILVPLYAAAAIIIGGVVLVIMGLVRLLRRH